MVQPFFARPFVWTPQIAWYKRMHKLPLSEEEQLYMTQGAVPFQQQVKTVYSLVGVPVGR